MTAGKNKLTSSIYRLPGIFTSKRAMGTFILILLALVISGIGCNDSGTDSGKDSILDDRTAYFYFSIYTESSEANGTQAYSARTDSYYSTPWNPGGDGVWDVIEEIENCGIMLNSTILIPDTTFRGVYKSPEVLDYQVDETAVIRLDLPSQDTAYPDGYPTLQTSINLSPFTFNAPSIGDGVVAGDTLRFTWNRNLGDAYEIASRYIVYIESVQQCSYGYYVGNVRELIFYPEQNGTDSREGLTTVVLEEVDTDGVSVSIRFQSMATAGTRKVLDVVDGKQANISFVETRLFSVNYPVRSN